MSSPRVLAAVGGSLLLSLSVGCARPPADVDGARIARADAEPQNWMSYGRTYGEGHYSPLDKINAGNVGDLGLAWSVDFDTHRGQEATPIVVDGVMYVSTAWSAVRAFDARTGEPLWTYDPQVPRDTLVKACCDAVNRGVAVWKGKVFVGTLDGRLVALNAGTGAPVWSVLTTDPSKAYTITGAPRVVKGKVLIGNGGADMGTGIRGYVSAYDAETGRMAWRFYTVPDPSNPTETAAMTMALKTWKGDLLKVRGGGGTVWDAMAYDPELDLLYIGVGNGQPWNQAERSPGGGDNLFLTSIVALRPDSGEYVWHYQQNPGETWDYTATQPIILADLTIKAQARKVLMQAPKNGFFYLIDRTNGRLISAEKFVPVNWASRIDLRTGRPVENPAARYEVTGKPAIVWPSARGGHSWQPMSFSPKTGLVYIPAQDTKQVYGAEPGYAPRKVGFNTGVVEDGPVADAEWAAAPPSRAYLLAWDPVRQKEVWRVDRRRPAGGVLTTGGNLLVQGEPGGHVTILRADTGRELWRFDAQSNPMAGPITYAVGGEQFIAVMAGCGGDFGDACGLVDKSGRKPIVDRLLVFKLGGKGRLPPRQEPMPHAFFRSSDTFPAAQVARGRRLFDQYCFVCHGGEGRGGLNPDLRRSGYLEGDGFAQVVLNGALRDAGMASFAGVLSAADVAAIRAYVIGEARRAAAAQ
ncbi:PQQ-dependent dehydrogenase, methanol/ethanol family [Phenylobacterium sp.]|jgi:quinohemoprotein ethanol dehydrogenase|uniref:PQQ-dependent dehydrogenase, methanol/ethanol family n=1 Tax=Phenylobacterium sp. TaxID=1871053 RepID=UPI0037843C9D